MEEEPWEDYALLLVRSELFWASLSTSMGSS
jgi:hypothetical protein